MKDVSQEATLSAGGVDSGVGKLRFSREGEIRSCNMRCCMAAGVAALAVSCKRFRYGGGVPAQATTLRRFTVSCGCA